MKPRHFALIATLLTWSVAAAAPVPGGALDGIVVDGDGTAVDGVAVTASSSALMGTRETTTDAAGRFRLPALPPGSYGVTFDLVGFQWVEYEAVQVYSGSSVSLKVVMERTDADEVVIFTGGPDMDVNSAAHARSFAATELEVLPSGSRRGAGGAGPEWANDSTRVLWSSTPATPTTGMLLLLLRDGTSRSRGEHAGPEASLADLRYGFAGQGADRAGGFVPEVEVFSPAGGESLHGGVAASGAAGGGVGAGGSRGGQWAPHRQGRLALSLGGAIDHERLWFFAAVEGASSDDELTGGKELGQPLIDSRGRRDRVSAFGRLSWRANASHGVDLRLEWARDSTEDDLVDPFFTAAGSEPAFAGDRSSLRLGLAWHGLASDILVISAGADGRRAQEDLRPQSTLPLRQDLSVGGVWSGGIGNGVFSGGPGFPDYRSEDDSRSLAAGFEWSVASGHVLTAGVGAARTEHARSQAPGGRRGGPCAPLSPGGAVVFDPAAGAWQPLQAICDSDGDGIDDGIFLPNPSGNRVQLGDDGADLLRWYGAQNTGGQTTDLHLFLQDRWAPSARLSITAGLRLSASEHRGAAREEGTARLDLGAAVAPRLGLAWDFEGNGRSRAYAHWGRFHMPVQGTVARRLFGFEDMSLTHFDPPGNETPADLFVNAIRPPAPVRVDPATEQPSFDELVIGVDYELLGGLVVGAAFSDRSLNEAVIDLSTDGGATIVITNQDGSVPESSGEDAGSDRQVMVPEAVLNQTVATLFAHLRFNGRWQLYTSLSWSSSEGNVDLGKWSEIELADSGFAADFTSPEALVNARGDLPDDRRWRFTTFGTYVWERGFMASAALSHRSGAPLSKLGALSMGRGLDQRFVSGRGSEGRSPGVWTVDLRLAQPLSVGAGDLEAWLEIANLLGGDTAVRVDQRWSVLDEEQTGGLDVDGQQTSDLWGSPLVVQQPRRIEVGLRYGW